MDAALRRLVPFDHTAIFLRDPVKDVLRLFVLESAWVSRCFVVGLEMPPSGSHVGWVFRQGRPLLRRDLARRPERRRSRRAGPEEMHRRLREFLLAHLSRRP